MNKHLLSLAALAALSVSPAVAQDTLTIKNLPPTRKGNVTIGSGIGLANLTWGNVSYPDGRLNYDVALTPTVGYFLNSHWMLNGAVLGGLSAQPTEFAMRYRTSHLGMGIGARYYFGKATQTTGAVTPLRFYAEGGLNYAHYWIRTTAYNERTYRSQSNNFGFNLGAGASYFINQNAAVEAGVNWTNWSLGDRLAPSERNMLQFRVGLRFFLNR